MPWLSSIERRGFEKGEEKGLRTGILEGIMLDLNAKFGQRGRQVLRKVRTLKDVAELRDFAKFLKNTQSLDEVRQRLS